MGNKKIKLTIKQLRALIRKSIIHQLKLFAENRRKIKYEVNMLMQVMQHWVFYYLILSIFLWDSLCVDSVAFPTIIPTKKFSGSRSSLSKSTSHFSSAILHRLDNDSLCGQFSVPSAYAPFIQRFGGASLGSCIERGYEKFQRQEIINMGPFGSFVVTIFSKDITT